MIYEIADECVREVEKLTDQWEIYIDNSECIEVESKLDVLNFAKEEIDKGVGIRVIKDNKIGFAYTTDLDKIPQTAQKALDNAKLNKVDKNYEFAKVEKVSDIKGTYDKKYDDLSLDECCEFLENIIARTKENECNITSTGFSAMQSEELILNSNGVSIYDKNTGFSGGLSITIEKDGQIATAYDYKSSRLLDLEYEKLTDDVCKIAKDSLNPKAIETKKCDVVDAEGNILVDDCLKNLDEWALKKGFPIFFDYDNDNYDSWNQPNVKSYTRIRDLSSFIKK